MKKILILTIFLFASCNTSKTVSSDRPNFLICISDDQSYPHSSAYGYAAVKTPAFDRVAEAGVLFNNAFTPAPGCSPMRAAFLTGRNIWEIEHAGTHASSFPKKYTTFSENLETAGYHVGHTGKGWSPGNWKVSGRIKNPAGTAYNQLKNKRPTTGIAPTDYAGNFKLFLKANTSSKPFCFWYGSREPHRGFEKGSGIKAGMDPKKVKVPSFLPDTPEIRSDILDYCLEIEWFDKHIARMMKTLKEQNKYHNTVIIVTSDNGMAFPYAKANANEYGIHMPLAISWPAKIKGKRKCDDIVNLIDVTASIYELSGVKPPSTYPLSGDKLGNLLLSGKQGQIEKHRTKAFSGRERHSSSRFNTLSYPQRTLRTKQFIYIRNFRPERWPAGTPPLYADIDGCPSLSFLKDNKDNASVKPFFHLAVDHRPAEELYDITKDPDCTKNLATKKQYQKIKSSHAKTLIDYLKKTKDPRVVAKDGGDIWETYPRYSHMRWFPEPQWYKDKVRTIPTLKWLEEKRSTETKKKKGKKKR